MCESMNQYHGKKPLERHHWFPLNIKVTLPSTNMLRHRLSSNTQSRLVLLPRLQGILSYTIKLIEKSS